MDKENKTRQITLHFDDTSVKILEGFEERAKAQMRTTEAQILWELKQKEAGNGVA